MKKYFSMMMAVIFLSVTTGVCLASTWDEPVKPIVGQPTEFSVQAHVMTPEKAKAYESPDTWSHKQTSTLANEPYTPTEFSEKAHAMTPEKAKAYKTNRIGIGGSECKGR